MLGSLLHSGTPSRRGSSRNRESHPENTQPDRQLNPEIADSTFLTEVSLGLSKMGSALLDSTVDTTPANAAGNSSSAEALRLQVAERLAAHRSRRGLTQAQPEASSADTRQGNTRAARIAAAVAERYAKSPSYRAILAAEAERAVQQARAAAEVAARNARAVAAVQQQLLDGLREDAASEDISQDDIAESEAERRFARAEFPEPSALELSLRGRIWSRQPEAAQAARKERTSRKVLAQKLRATRPTTNPGLMARRPRVCTLGCRPRVIPIPSPPAKPRQAAD